MSPLTHYDGGSTDVCDGALAEGCTGALGDMWDDTFNYQL